MFRLTPGTIAWLTDEQVDRLYLRPLRGWVDAAAGLLGGAPAGRPPPADPLAPAACVTAEQVPYWQNVVDLNVARGMAPAAAVAAANHVYEELAAHRAEQKR